MNNMDLFVLAADLDMSSALEGLLSRSGDLGIRDVTFDICRHPDRDSGCRTGSVEFLRPHLERYDRALIVFDRHGCGDSRPSRSKPPDPKRAMGAVMQTRRIRLSARRFSELAENADFDGCRDPAFNELRQTLQAWFPPEAAA